MDRIILANLGKGMLQAHVENTFNLLCKNV